MRARRVTPDQDPSSDLDAMHSTLGVIARDQECDLMPHLQRYLSCHSECSGKSGIAQQARSVRLSRLPPFLAKSVFLELDQLVPAYRQAQALC